MSDRFDAAHFTVEGLPEVGQALSIGDPDSPQVFPFVASPTLPLGKNIVIGDSPSNSELADRIHKRFINHSIGCTATVFDNVVSLVPDNTMESVLVTSDAPNVPMVGDSPNAGGVILSGID
jgi:hypothetical protein